MADGGYENCGVSSDVPGVRGTDVIPDPKAGGNMRVAIKGMPGDD